MSPLKRLKIILKKDDIIIYLKIYKIKIKKIDIINN